MITILLHTDKSSQDDDDALNSRNIEKILEGQEQDRKTQKTSSNRQIIVVLALFIAATTISAIITLSIYFQNTIVAIGAIIGAIIVVVMIRKRLG